MTGQPLGNSVRSGKPGAAAPVSDVLSAGWVLSSAWAVLGPGGAVPGGFGGSPPGSDPAGLRPSSPGLGQQLLRNVSRPSDEGWTTRRTRAHHVPFAYPPGPARGPVAGAGGRHVRLPAPGP